MARSTHPRYTAVDRYERRSQRRQQVATRRTGTRSAVILAALQEA